MSLGTCVSEVTKKQIDDVQNGLKYFSKFPSLLMCPAKQGKIEDTNTFISTLEVNAATNEIEKGKIDYI